MPYFYFYVWSYLYFGSSSEMNTLVTSIFSIYIIFECEGMHYRYLKMLFEKLSEIKNLETKWYNTLLNMPNGVILYSINTL